MARTFASRAERLAWIGAQRAAKVPFKEIAAELGVSASRARDLHALFEDHERRKADTSNLSALSVRARNAVRSLVQPHENETRAEADAAAPARVAGITSREFLTLPSAGRKTLIEITAWLEARGYSWRNDAKARAGFIAVSEWRVKPGEEAQFLKAWRRDTLAVRLRYGSLGSRLCRTADGRFLAVTEWPDAETWRAAAADRMVHADEEASALLAAALLSGEGEPIALAMTVIDDKLIRQATGGDDPSTSA